MKHLLSIADLPTRRGEAVDVHADGVDLGEMVK